MTMQIATDPERESNDGEEFFGTATYTNVNVDNATTTAGDLIEEFDPTKDLSERLRKREPEPQTLGKLIHKLDEYDTEDVIEALAEAGYPVTSEYTLKRKD